MISSCCVRFFRRMDSVPLLRVCTLYIFSLRMRLFVSIVFLLVFNILILDGWMAYCCMYSHIKYRNNRNFDYNRSSLFPPLRPSHTIIQISIQIAFEFEYTWISVSLYTYNYLHFSCNILTTNRSVVTNTLHDYIYLRYIKKNNICE